MWPIYDRMVLFLLLFLIGKHDFRYVFNTFCLIFKNIFISSGAANVEVNVVDSARGSIVVNLPPRSIHTLLYR